MNRLPDIVAAVSEFLSGKNVDHCLIGGMVENLIVQRAHPVSFGDTLVPVIRLEDLVAMKLATGRLRDDADAEELLERADDLALDALYAVAQHFGVEQKARVFVSNEEE